MSPRRWPRALPILVLACTSWGPEARAISGAAPTAADPRLSGRYQVRFGQSAKTCGPLIKPVETQADLEIAADRIKVRFPTALFGLQSLDLTYDASRDPYETHIERRVSLGPTQATLSLDLQIRVRHRDGKPAIDFTVHFKKVADDPRWNCEVRGEGQATRIGDPA